MFYSRGLRYQTDIKLLSLSTEEKYSEEERLQMSSCVFLTQYLVLSNPHHEIYSANSVTNNIISLIELLKLLCVLVTKSLTNSD